MKTQTFGIEIETTGLGRERTAKALAAHFGTTAIYVGRHLDDWKVPMPDGRTWTVERDGSVTEPNAEVVSPVCTYDDLPMVQDAARALREAGARCDASCGIHIHIGLGDHTAQSLVNLVNMVNAKEDLLEHALQISPDRRATWCKPVDPEFLRRMNAEKPKTMDALATIWYETQGSGWSVASSRREHYDRSRYHLLNLHAAFSTERPAHTIEFRAFNGTLHAGKIKAYIQLCLAINAAAKASKSARPARPHTANEKYTFRCWLIGPLGLNGDEFKTARLHLLANLEGDAAFANPERRRAHRS